ncbi:MAG: hypothetical protein HYZ81_02985 [Nitrospinae bacterium]|nr:hypothetical protein [Nitrospinota bacterium]
MSETFPEIRDRVLRRVTTEVDGQLARAHTTIEQAFYCGELRGIADVQELEAVDDFPLLLSDLGHMELCRPDRDRDLTFVDPRLHIPDVLPERTAYYQGRRKIIERIQREVSARLTL